MTSIPPVSHSTAFPRESEDFSSVDTLPNSFVPRIQRAQVPSFAQSDLKVEQTIYAILHLYVLHKYLENLRENFRKFYTQIINRSSP